MQIARIPRRKMLLCVACPALHHFSTLSRKGHDFWLGGGLMNKNACFDFLYDLGLNRFLILRGVRRDSVYVRYFGRIPVILEFCRQIF